MHNQLKQLMNGRQLKDVVIMVTELDLLPTILMTKFQCSSINWLLDVCRIQDGYPKIGSGLQGLQKTCYPTQTTANH